MKTKVEISLGFLLVLGLPTLLIILGSTDASDFDDYGMLDHIDAVPPDQNGYQELGISLKDQFEVLSNEEQQAISWHLTFDEHSEWDQEFVTTLLDSKQHLIERVRASITYPKFQFTEFREESSVDVVPSFVPIRQFSQLILLQSINEAKSGDLEKSLASLDVAIWFFQQIGSEPPNSMLIALVRQSMQHTALEWITELATEYELSASEYDRLRSILDTVHEYRADGFKNVFVGELLSVSITSPEHGDSLKLSLADFAIDFESSQHYPSRKTNNQEDSWLNRFMEKTTTDIKFLLNRAFNRYTYHPNRVIQSYADRMRSLSAISELYCVDIDSRLNESFYSPKLRDRKARIYHAILPNGTGMFVSNAGARVSYKKYFEARCALHSYVSAVKVTLALGRYEQDIGALPDSLQELVPEYLSEVPVDAFDGRPIKYSKENRWLYSVGANYEDNGGSKTAEYDSRGCLQNDECINNPTFQF